MAKGEGKGWAKGKSAATDARVAKAAAAHRGMTYQRRTPRELCRWTRVGAPPMSVGWSSSMAYVVGLIATDGCLIASQRRVDFVTVDEQLVETLVDLLGRSGRFRRAKSRIGTTIYRAQIKDASWYRWLLTIGLTPRKSLTLGALDVPDEFLSSLVRGLLDGDGSIVNFVSRADTTRRPDGSYRYEWFRARFISASREHLEWLQGRIRAARGISGSLVGWGDGQRRTMHRLEFGRWDSMRLLSWIYADRTAPCLLRKRAIWDGYATRYALDVAKA